MEVAQLKFKGNQKHYELNTAVDSSLENIDGKIQLCLLNPQHILKLAQDTKQKIQRRQKLIEISEKSKQDWQVVEEEIFFKWW